MSAKVFVPEKVLLREVAGEAVILNLNNEQYYGLDEIGTRFWTMLTTSSSIREAIDDLLAEYDVDRATLEQDMRDLLSKLAEQGLVELRNE
ncbi:MAG: PqqD family protein [Anaerolineae bacterium]|nr:PqqD family protein [Anaerolineae bacterium]